MDTKDTKMHWTRNCLDLSSSGRTVYVFILPSSLLHKHVNLKLALIEHLNQINSFQIKSTTLSLSLLFVINNFSDIVNYSKLDPQFFKLIYSFFTINIIHVLKNGYNGS